MNTTLTDIVDAMHACGVRDGSGKTKDAKAALLARARMLRDRKLIRTSLERDGRTSFYSEADVVAAVCTLAASLSGWSQGLIGLLNLNLRPFESSKRPREFERHLDDVKNGSPIIIRAEVISTPWGYVDVRMGEPESVRASDTTDELVLSRNELPVTELARPVLQRLAAAQ